MAFNGLLSCRKRWIGFRRKMGSRFFYVQCYHYFPHSVFIALCHWTHSMETKCLWSISRNVFFHQREFKVVVRQCLSNGLILHYEQDRNQFCLGCWQVNYWALIPCNRTLKRSPLSEPWDNRKDDTFPMSPCCLFLNCLYNALIWI